MSSHGPVGSLACPARFERATWALEAGKMSSNNSRNNSFKGVSFWCPVGTENLGVGWNLIDPECYQQAVNWSDI